MNESLIPKICSSHSENVQTTTTAHTVASSLKNLKHCLQHVLVLSFTTNFKFIKQEYFRAKYWDNRYTFSSHQGVQKSKM